MMYQLSVSHMGQIKNAILREKFCQIKSPLVQVYKELW